MYLVARIDSFGRITNLEILTADESRYFFKKGNTYVLSDTGSQIRDRGIENLIIGIIRLAYIVASQLTQIICESIANGTEMPLAAGEADSSLG